ncbi:MAG: ABC transporter substrate-binding protein [Alicyclobacillus sp.]|nr:ABC transporter substrate-binding protein [Alicyclobacillus sp.]
MKPSSSGGSAGLTTIRVGLSVADYPPFTPIYVAQEKGYFKQLGLDVQVTAYNGGSISQGALASGAEDMIHFSPSGVALAVSKGVKEKMIAADQLTPSGWAVVVKKDSPYKSPKDLNGKTIGITSTGSSTDFYARWMLQNYGIQAKIVPLGNSGLVPALESGKVDAFVASPEQYVNVVSSHKAEPILDLGKALPPSVADGIVAAQGFLDQHPDAVQRYLEGYFEALKYMQTHPDYTVPFLEKSLKMDSQEAQMIFDMVIKDIPADGMFQESWIQESLQLAQLAGIKNMAPEKDIVDMRFLPVKAPNPPADSAGNSTSTGTAVAHS